MENFNYYNPTKVIFGKNTENNVGAEAKIYGKKVLILCLPIKMHPEALT